MVALGSDEALLSTLTVRNITDLSTEGAQLGGGMDCVPLSIVCILMHNEYGGSTMLTRVVAFTNGISRMVESPIPVTLALEKSKVERMRASEPVIPPLAPPSIRELRGDVEAWLEKLY